MYRRMLVPLDGSKLAEETFPYARELAGRLDLSLDFLHVSNRPEGHLVSMSQKYVDTMAELVREQINNMQTTTRAKEEVHSIEINGKVVTGYPAEEILKYAEMNNIDIILMATHGASGVRRWALGSVAYQVLHASKIPVWLIRSGVPEEIIYDKWPQRTILVPLDGSKLAETALPHAEALVKQRGTQVIEILLFSVYPPVNFPTIYNYEPAYPPALPPNYADFVQFENNQVKDRCEKYLKNVANRLTGQGIKVRTECVMGDATDEIIKYTNKYPFQLIVMASRGRSGLRHLTFGSVTESILLESRVPVFVVTAGNNNK